MTDLLPEQQPPERKPAFYPTADGGDDVDIRVTCLPSLGRVTTVAKEQGGVKFAVLLETTSPSLLAEDEPQVCLWHNHNGHSDWAELPLRTTKAYEDALLVNTPDDRSLSRCWFEAELPGLPKHAQVTSFTVKFRVGTDKGWKWVRDTTNVEDGSLHYQGQDYQKHSQHELKQFFSGISPDIKVASERAQTDATLIYSLSAPVNAAEGKASGYSHHQLGLPTHLSRWFAEVRIWSPWLAPRQGGGKFKLDKEGVLLSFLRSDGMHVAVLGVSGVKDVLTTFINDDDGNVIIKARNERAEPGTSEVIIAVAESFEVANAAVFYHARDVVSQSTHTSTKKDIQSLVDDVKPEWMEEWYDGFTYCTWNALGQDLTADKINHALDDLSKEDINITNLIIDDNWQSLSGEQGVDDQMSRGWTDFEANKKGFPDGMKATTAAIRKRHPNINHIAVWHAILGYWGGVSPDGWIAKHYKTVSVKKNDGEFTVVAAEDAQRMYDDFYRFLSASGVDSVKTDAQFMLDEIHDAPDRRALITEYQDAWTLAHLRHFGSRAISCMSQVPQLMFHSQLPRNKPRLLVRNSDDFFPDVDASHPWHIFCNAHNSVIAQHLNVLPDWDMFQTSHPWASFHAAARCISGGPIYFTDYPGKHDIKLIRQITAQTTRGKTVILRPSVVGRALDPYNEYGTQAMLKVGTYVGYARTGTGVLGLFNVASREVREFVRLTDFPGTDEGDYVIQSFVSGEVSRPMSRAKDQGLVRVELPVQQWDILSAYALRGFSVGDRPLQVGLFGLLGKMTGSAAVTGSEMHVESNGRLRVWASFKALGVVGLYVSELPSRSIDKDFMIMIFGRPIPVHCVRVNEVCDRLLEIDVERAWKENEERAGWSNEVSIEVFMH